MKIVTIERNRPALQLTLEPEEYDVLFAVLRHVGGDPEGPRGLMENFRKMLVKTLDEDEDDWADELPKRKIFARGGVTLSSELEED